MSLPSLAINLSVGPREADDAVSVMHAAFAEVRSGTWRSGAMLETARTLRDEMGRGVAVGLALRGERPVGMVKHKPADDGTRYFSRLGVVPDQRRMGVASALLEALRADALKVGLAGLSCMVRADATANIAFYERAGMVIVERGKSTSMTGAVLDVVRLSDPTAARQ